MKKANLIITGDWHLRENPPECWTGDFWKEQWDSVQFVNDLQQEHNCEVIHTGDLFDYWKPSLYLLSYAAMFIPKKFKTVYGNHDLPQHNLDLAYKCGTNLLVKAKLIELLTEAHFGMHPKNGSLLYPNTNRKVSVWHTMVYKKVMPYPGCTAPKAVELLKKYPQFDLIATGDNHKPFVQEYNGRLLVNPGSLTRQTVDQIDFKPRVYLWYADTNTVEPVYIPIKKDVISREHIEKKEQKENRLAAFVERLDDDWQAELSYEENLKSFEKTNNVHKKVMNIVYKALETE